MKYITHSKLSLKQSSNDDSRWLQSLPQEPQEWRFHTISNYFDFHCENQSNFKKNIIQRFTEAVWDELEAGWPVLASFSSREFFWWNFFDEQRFRWKKIWWKHIMVLMIKHWIFLKHLSTLRYELNNMHHKSPTKSLKNKVISNFPKQMCPLRWTATTHI